MKLSGIPHAAELAEVGQTAFDTLDPKDPTSASVIVTDALRNRMIELDFPDSVSPEDVAIAVLSPSQVDTINNSDGYRVTAARNEALRLAIGHSMRMRLDGLEVPMLRATLPSVIDEPGTLAAAQDRIIGHPMRKVSAVTGLTAVTAGTLFFGLMGLDTSGKPKDASDFLHNISFTYVADPSIFPGKTGENIPLLGAIPGVPDQPNYDTTAYAEKEVSVPVKVSVPATLGALARNPVAVNMKLTGEEAKLNMKAAQDALDAVKAQGITVDRAVATGYTSDMYANEVGVRDPEQIPLGLMRAEEMSKAVTSLADKQKEALPEPEVVAVEDVLTQPEQQALKKAAEKLGIDEATLLERYRTSKLPAALIKQIDGFSHPGAGIELYGHKTVITHTKKTVDTLGSKLHLGFPGEILAFMGLASGAGVGFLAGFRRYANNASKLAHRKAVRSVNRQL